MPSTKPLKVTQTELPVYPFRWEGLEDFDYPLDQNGVPQVDMGLSLGLQYNPVTIAQYGLWQLQKFAESRADEHKAAAGACVEWFLQNYQVWRSDIGGWVFQYDLDLYGPKAPWISGMAQGEAISLLLRFNQVAPVANVKEITEGAFKAFLNPVAEGGVVAHFPDGSLVFEEYTTEVPSLVLNGHIFALLGIHDYATYWREKAAQDLLEVAASGLLRNLHLYDTGYWNLYDLHPTRRLASRMYLKVHVQLLRILAELTGETPFLDTAEKWQSYLTNPLSNLRWFLGKIIEKIRL